MRWVVWGVAALIVAFAAYMRLAPVDETSGPGRPEAQPVGDYPSEGGFYAVREGVRLEALYEVARAASRTRELSTGIFMTRSRVWGFPDITHIWEEDGAVHISAHLVIGSSDLGANKARVGTWLAEARTKRP